jgi:hypothetical protein
LTSLADARISAPFPEPTVEQDKVAAWTKESSM